MHLNYFKIFHRYQHKPLHRVKHSVSVHSSPMKNKWCVVILTGSDLKRGGPGAEFLPGACWANSCKFCSKNVLPHCQRTWLFISPFQLMVIYRAISRRLLRKQLNELQKPKSVVQNIFQDASGGLFSAGGGGLAFSPLSSPLIGPWISTVWLLSLFSLGKFSVAIMSKVSVWSKR